MTCFESFISTVAKLEGLQRSLADVGAEMRQDRDERFTGEVSQVEEQALVEELREQLGWYCAHLSTSMTFDTDVDQNILNSFFEGGKAGAHWGRHNRKIQYGRQPILDFVITS